MISLYLNSILVYMIIIFCMCMLFESSIREKGWVSTEKAKGNKLVGLFVLSAVPVVRVAVIVFIFYAATHTKEDFEKLQEEVKKKQNENK